MNRYTANLSRIEFLVTLACTGRCIHCSEGVHSGEGAHLDPQTAAKVIYDAAGCRQIDSVMTFGGEPMLYPETVCAVHAAAREIKIPKRQLITNGFFSRNVDKIAAAAASLAEAGVNDILISADAFHQEAIPVGPVKLFAMLASRQGIPVRVHPAWLVSREHENPYNLRTREILAEFEAAGIAPSKGNIVFPRGNALEFLNEYFDSDAKYEDPYEEDPADIRAICIDPNGDVLGGNIFRTDIVSIIEEYAPQGLRQDEIN